MNNGFKDAFRYPANYLKASRIFGDYLDAIGILDGLYAYKGPSFAQIDLTNNCNNDCIGCWCNSPLLEEKKIDASVKGQTISFKRAVRLIDELYKIAKTSKSPLKSFIMNQKNIVGVGNIINIINYFFKAFVKVNRPVVRHF